MQGVWQSATISAAFDVQAHEAGYQIPAGPSVIVDPPDGKLPHLPDAAKKAKLNWEERDRDPVGYCHPHGVPRQLVPPFPLEFVEDGDYFAILSETEHSVRVIPTLRFYERRFADRPSDQRGSVRRSDHALAGACV